MPGNEETTKADLGQGEKPEIPAGKGFVGLGQTEECQGERGSCALRGLGGLKGDPKGWRGMEGDLRGSRGMEEKPRGALEGVEREGWRGWSGNP